jgi:hypothetical protein
MANGFHSPATIQEAVAKLASDPPPAEDMRTAEDYAEYRRRNPLPTADEHKARSAELANKLFGPEKRLLPEEPPAVARFVIEQPKRRRKRQAQPKPAPDYSAWFKPLPKRNSWHGIGDDLWKLASSGLSCLWCGILFVAGMAMGIYALYQMFVS